VRTESETQPVLAARLSLKPAPRNNSPDTGTTGIVWTGMDRNRRGISGGRRERRRRRIEDRPFVSAKYEASLGAAVGGLELRNKEEQDSQSFLIEE